mmetsp:Transcript_42642/g.101977  ORF Transcript_42642/g.101977 Transcript_42642/m.101977 type:complete len:278 (+) Transcript_42642:35-868(+)
MRWAPSRAPAPEGRASDEPPSEVEDGIQSVMVTPPRSQVVGTARGAVAEDVVHTAHLHTAEGPVDVGVHGLDPRGVRLRVEVAHDNDQVSVVRMGANHLQDVVGGGGTCAPAAMADGERAMVVQEEHRAAAAVQQPDPLRSTLAVVLAVVVLSHVVLALSEPSEAAPAPRDGESAAAVHEFVLIGEAHGTGVADDARHVVALLEAHEVVALGAARAGDLRPGTPAVAPAPAEEVPPVEVVGEDLQGRGATRHRAGLEVPSLLRHADLAPLAARLHRA